MSKTVEELLKPRYKVIGRYPDSPVEVGDIITEDDCFFISSFDELSEYPLIFRPLKWWKDRPIEDMPKYVKDHHGQKVLPFRDFTKTNEAYEGAELDWEWGSWHISLFLPATEAEYNNYKAKKDGTVNR